MPPSDTIPTLVNDRLEVSGVCGSFGLDDAYGVIVAFGGTLEAAPPFRVAELGPACLGCFQGVLGTLRNFTLLFGFDNTSIDMSETDIVKVILGLLGPVSTVIAAILILALMGLGIYLRRYLEQKALQLATREDFGKLQKQVADSTRLVESIKSELANEDWVRRELHALRVKKIEELITLALNCETNLESHRNAAIRREYFSLPREYNELYAIATVYLPELEPITQRYRLALLTHSQQITERGMEVARTGNVALWDGFMETSNYPEVLSIFTELKAQAANLLRETANGTVFRQVSRGL